MRDNIVSYQEMCANERMSLQRGMNFLPNSEYSIVLMSVRVNAPYDDQVIDDGRILIYEGHDVPKSADAPIPQIVNQVDRLPSGKLNENGKFLTAAARAKSAGEAPRIVRAYEKIKKGIWIDNGFFELVDGWPEISSGRKVFKFKLVATQYGARGRQLVAAEGKDREPPRVIPSAVKVEVWKRDGGQCVECGANDELHFDHIVPYSKGGSSLTAENVQLLCMRHNLAKRDKIV